MVMAAKSAKQLRGLGGAVIGDLVQAKNPAVNPFQRTINNASPAAPQAQQAPVTGVSPIADAMSRMSGMAVAGNSNPAAYAGGQIKMNNSSNKTGRVIS